MCTVFPTNKTTHAIHPNETNCPHTIYPNDANRPCAIHPNETVGAVPVCPPERPRSGVSIPKIHALCAGILTMDAPLQGDTGGHTGTAPTKLHHIFPHIPHKQNNHLRAIHSNNTNRPTRNSSQTKSTVPHVICPNETVGANIRAQFSQAKCVGAVPACPPERLRSGVSIPKIYALCARI